MEEAGIRLNKMLSEAGVCSRREADRLIEAGRITVDGVTASMGQRILPGQQVLLDGKAVGGKERPVLLLVNKPAGVVCTTAEFKNEKNMVDMVDYPVRLYPVGRLDKDTEGLLIITNDGPLAHQLLVPKHHIDKTYYAIVTGTITEDDQCAFTRGIRYDEKLTALPATLRVLSTGKTVAALRRELGFTATSERLLRTRLAGPAFIGAEEPADITDDTLVSEVEITIQEGKFHQIKKMVKALPGGKEILYLRRITMGALRLDPDLAPGEFRKLRQDEIKILKDSVE